jgi:hypothetical protein
LDDGHAGPLVEINTPITNHVNQPQARIETVNAATKVTKADDVILMLANIILAGGAFLCLLVSFYIIYYYGWTAQRYFSAPPGALLYCVLPAVLASLLFGFLRRSREFKAKAAIVSVSVALSVYAMELLTAFVMPPSSSGILWGDGHLDEKKAKEIVALAKQFGVDFDTRSRLEVIMDLQRQGIQAVPSIIPLALLEKQPDGTVKSKISVHGAEVLPVGGISHRVTVLCNEMGDYAIYDSDEHGFHNPAGIWRSPSIAVASVGDSFTQGACVLSDKNFMALIRNRYPSALNLGMSGEGPLFMLAALTEYLQLMKPPVVLWFFYEENDFSDLSKEHQSPLLRQYLGDNFTQGLFGRQAEIDESLGRYVEQEMKSQLAHKGEATRDRARKDGWYGIGKLAPFLQIAHLRQRFGLIYGRTAQQVELAQYNEAQFDLFDKVLARAKGLVEAWGGRLYFVYLPARDRYAEQQDYQRRSILNIVRHAGISIIDVHARFRQESDPLSLFPFGRFGHYNEKGNRLVAEEVLRAIELNGSHSEGP